jgi:hypothetical protein
MMNRVIISGLLCFLSVGFADSQVSIFALDKNPPLMKRVIEEKEILSYAKLESLPNHDSLKKYSFYAAMLVGNSLEQTRGTLLNYKLYPEMIHYIDRADFRSSDQSLLIVGGIWKFKLTSRVRFEQKSDRWVHFQIVEGHFLGMSGDLFFEPKAEKGTLVYIAGEQKGEKWPPRFVIERGAEIVFGFTGRRMRSYIESQKKIEKGASNDGQRQDVPRPRGHL